MELQSPVVSVRNTCRKLLISTAARQSTQSPTSANKQSVRRPDQQVVWQPRLSLPIINSKKPRRQFRCAAQAAASPNMKVGFVGVGIMGLAMVGMHSMRTSWL